MIAKKFASRTPVDFHAQYQFIVEWQDLGDFIFSNRPANKSPSVTVGNKIINSISLQYAACLIPEGTAKRHAGLHALGNIHLPWEIEFD